MALTFDFTNNPEDFVPEIVLKANTGNSAEKLLMYNILNGAYGKPVIMQEGSTQDKGMATVVKIGFEEDEDEEEDENYESPSFSIPYYTPDTYYSKGYFVVIEEVETVSIGGFQIIRRVVNLYKSLIDNNDSEPQKEYKDGEGEWEFIVSLKP